MGFLLLIVIFKPTELKHRRVFNTVSFSITYANSKITHPKWNRIALEKLVLTGFSDVSRSTSIEQRKKTENQNLVIQKLKNFYMMLNKKSRHFQNKC